MTSMTTEEVKEFQDLALPIASIPDDNVELWSLLLKSKWHKITVPRKSTKTFNSDDYWFEPTNNQRFRSFPEIRRYLYTRRKILIRTQNARKGIFPTQEELDAEKGPTSRGKLTQKRPRGKTNLLKQRIGRMFQVPASHTGKAKPKNNAVKCFFGTISTMDRDKDNTERYLYHCNYDDGDEEDLLEEQVDAGIQLYYKMTSSSNSKRHKKLKSTSKSNSNSKSKSKTKITTTVSVFLNSSSNQWTPPRPLGSRKAGAFGCGKCRWYPKGCRACRNAGYVSAPPVPMPPGQVCGDNNPSTQMADAFEIISDDRQSDATGYGIIAKRFIQHREKFVDNTTRYVSKPSVYAKAHLGAEDYIACGSGYFEVREEVMQNCAFSFFLNMAGYTQEQKDSGQCANIKWTKKHDHAGMPELQWLVTRDIQKGEEILVNYNLA